MRIYIVVLYNKALIYLRIKTTRSSYYNSSPRGFQGTKLSFIPTFLLGRRFWSFYGFHQVKFLSIHILGMFGTSKHLPCSLHKIAMAMGLTRCHMGLHPYNTCFSLILFLTHSTSSERGCIHHPLLNIKLVRYAKNRNGCFCVKLGYDSHHLYL